MTSTWAMEMTPFVAGPVNFNVNALAANFWQLTIDGLAYGSIYALVAVGYTLVYGVLRLINFAHSEIFMLGMFGAYFCLDIILGFTPSGNAYNKGVLLTVLYLIVVGVTQLAPDILADHTSRRPHEHHHEMAVFAFEVAAREPIDERLWLRELVEERSR